MVPCSQHQLCTKWGFYCVPIHPSLDKLRTFCKQSVNEESFLLLLSTRQPFPSSPALNDRTCAGTQPAARVYPGHKQKAGCRLGTPLPSFICCTALKNTSSAPSGTCPCAVPAAQSGPSRSAVHRRTHCHCCASPRPGASCCRDRAVGGREHWWHHGGHAGGGPAAPLPGCRDRGQPGAQR